MLDQRRHDHGPCTATGDPERLLAEGRARLDAGRLEEAAGSLACAVEAYRRHGDARGEAVAGRELGHVRATQGNVTAAVSSYRRSAELAAGTGDDELEARALVGLGSALDACGRTEEAGHALQRALMLARRAGRARAEVLALQALADRAGGQGRTREALATLELMLDAARRSAVRQDESWALALLALAHAACGERGPAIRRYRQALVLCGMLDLSLQGLHVRTGLADELRADGQFDAARAQLETVLRSPAADAAARRLALLQLAALEDECGEFERLVELARARHASARDSGDRAEQRAALSQEARAHWALGRRARAVELFHEAARLARELGHAEGENEAEAALRLAEAERDNPAALQPEPFVDTACNLLQSGDTDGARAFALEARALARARGAADTEALALSVLQQECGVRGATGQALHWAVEAVRLASAGDDPEALGRRLWELGSAYLAHGDVRRALRAAVQAAPRVHGDVKRRNCANMGLCHAQLGELESARRAAREVIELARAGGLCQGEAEGVELLGHVALLDGSTDEAAEHYLQAAALRAASTRADVTAPADADRAFAAALRGEHAAAVTHYERALAHIQVSAAAMDAPLAGMLGVQLVSCLVRAGRGTAALERARGILESTAPQADPCAQALAHHALAEALAACADAPAACAELQAAVVAWEAARDVLGRSGHVERAALLDGQACTYERLQELQLETGRPDLALETAERGRACALHELLAPLKSLDAWRLRDMQQAAGARGATLVAFSVLYDPAAVLTPARVRGVQPELERRLVAWLVPPSGELVVHETDLRAREGFSLSRLILDLHRSLANGCAAWPDASLTRRLARLHELLIEPLAPHLPADAGAPLVVVPHGLLQLVPFAALSDARDVHLIERHTLVTAPSIRTWAQVSTLPTRRTAWTTDEVLFVGDPDGSLPAAAVEAARLARLWDAAALLGPQATREAVVERLPGCRLLHFAGHGDWREVDDPGLRGALALASGDGGDGLLTAREILSLPLDCDLAVLAACDTARGRLSFDGGMGLPHAFLGAGARNVVASLWPVFDDSTAALMETFYACLRGRPGPAAALRQAMLSAIRAGASPRAWAGFTLTGAGA